MAQIGPLEIADRIAISDLLTAYSWAIDEGQSEALADLFLPDGEFIGSDGALTHGRDALIAFASRVFGARPGRLQHVAFNLVFVPESPDRIVVRSYVQVLHVSSDSPSLLALGSYRDDVLKTDEGWLFASRTFTNWRGDRTETQRPVAL